MIVFPVLVSSTGGVGKSGKGGSEYGKFGNGFCKRYISGGTRAEIGNSGSKKPNVTVYPI